MQFRVVCDVTVVYTRRVLTTVHPLLIHILLMRRLKQVFNTEHNARRTLALNYTASHTQAIVGGVTQW